MRTREEFLASVEEIHPGKFLQLMEEHNSKNESFDVMELLQTLTHEQHDNLWTGLNRMCAEWVVKLQASMSNEDEQETDQETDHEDIDMIVSCLNDIVTVGLCAISLDKPVMSSKFFETAIILHGCLLMMPEEAHKLQNNIALLCETWFINEHDGKEELVTHTLPYLLIKSLSQAKTVTVRRVWAMRQALLLLDYEDESSVSLKMILLQCMVHPYFIGNEEGRRFLSFLFGLNPEFIDDLHQVIKDNIPVCPMSSLASYGEVYFKAWRVASSPYLEKLENSCIQDLMFHAVHAQRQGAQSMAARLLKLLAYFHRQKKQHGVDELLLRLYQPILWRSFRVANSHVRANAALLLIDVFPLQHAQASHEEEDALMQRQFDILEDLLGDPCPTVRAIAVNGVSKIAKVFWELIPPQVLKNLISKMVEELAFDTSSAAVRLAVFKGLKSLLDNPLSNNLLKALLPTLANLIHDNSEKVRIIFLDIMLMVKNMKTIKFWNVVPLEHLLARLEIETSSHVIRRLVKLLLNSFHDITKTVDIQLDGCLTLWGENPAAARKFYQYLHLYVPIPLTVKFLNFTQRCIRSCIKRSAGNGLAQNGSSYDESFLSQSSFLSQQSFADRRNETTLMADNNDQELSLEDTDVMAGLLETIAILWISIAELLEKSSNEPLKAKMVEKFTKAVPEFFVTFKDGRCHAATLQIATHLPASPVSRFSGSCLSSLSSLDVDTPSTVYGPAIDCLCAWGKGSEIIQLLTRLIEGGLETSSLSNNGAARNAKNQRSRGRRNETQEDRSQLGLDFLSWIMEHPPCRNAVLGLTSEMTQLEKTLRRVMDVIEVTLTQAAETSVKRRRFLVQALQSFIHLSIHLQSKQQPAEDMPVIRCDKAVEALEHAVSWADRVVLPQLENCTDALPADDQQTRLTNKRAGEDDVSEESLQHQVVQALLYTASEMMMLGIGGVKFCSTLAEFTSSIVQHGGSLSLVTGMTKLMYQIQQRIELRKQVVNAAADPVTTVLGNILRCTSCQASNDSSKLQVLMNIRPILADVVKVSLCQESAPGSAQRAILSTFVALIVAEITDLEKESETLPVLETILDFPPTSATLLSVVCKKKSILRSFLSEIFNCLEAEAFSESDGFIAILVLISVLVKNGHTVDLMAACVQVVQRYFQVQPQDFRYRSEMATLAIEVLDKLAVS